MDEIFLFGIAFFGFMTIYNIIVSGRKKEYFPAIVSLLMTLASSLFFFEQFFFGSAFIFAAILLSIAKFSKSMDIQRKKVSQEFEMINYKEPLKLKDFLSWKSWGKIARKYGAKKAAFLYSLLIAVFMTLMLLLLLTIFEDTPDKSFILTFVITYSIVSYYHHSRIFKQSLKDMDENC